MGGPRRQRRKTIFLLIVAALAAGIGVLGYSTHVLRRSELQSIDARFSIRGKQAPPADVVLVAIDPATLYELRNRHMSRSRRCPAAMTPKSSITCASPAQA